MKLQRPVGGRSASNSVGVTPNGFELSIRFQGLRCQGVIDRKFTSELPFRRLEHAPGGELQVDFGTGAWVLEGGKKRRPHLFRAVLSYSRKGYTEVVWQQGTEAFIRCLENAFRHFGGVPVRLVIDNLKAGLLRADWFDPDLNPKLVKFSRHYGTVLAPTKPAMPRHKGKVENGVGYSQGNALNCHRGAKLQVVQVE